MNRLLACILILSLCLTGCRADKGLQYGENETEMTTAGVVMSEGLAMDVQMPTETEPDVQEESGAEAESPVYGGTLKMSMRKPHTLNPLLNEDITVDLALRLMFEPLFVLDDNQSLKPNLADGYLLSNDGKSLAVSIRNDAKWSDGTAVTADDMIFSLDVIAKAPAGSVYKNVLTNVSGYHKTSSSTVVIEYSQPFGGCAYNLCFPLIPRHYYQGADSIESPKSMKPLGNGLYTFESYRVVREMKLKAGENFRGKPYIENILVTIMNDKATDISAFERGLTDVISLTPEEYGSYNSANPIEVTPYVSNQFEFLGFNFKNNALADRSIRQAVAYAMPVDNIIENIYLGNAKAAITPVHPDSVLKAKTGVTEYVHSLSKAKELVASTGLTTDQLTFTILVNEENKVRCEAAELIASELNQTGMRVSVYRAPFDKYLSILQSDSFSMFLGGAELTSRVDLRPLLASYAQGNGSGMNYFNFSDGQMDSLLTACVNAGGDEGYKQAIAQVEKYCATQLPLIGIGFKSDLLLTDGAVKGTKTPAVNDIFKNAGSWYIKQN